MCSPSQASQGLTHQESPHPFLLRYLRSKAPPSGLRTLSSEEGTGCAWARLHPSRGTLVWWARPRALLCPLSWWDPKGCEKILLFLHQDRRRLERWLQGLCPHLLWASFTPGSPVPTVPCPVASAGLHWINPEFKTKKHIRSHSRVAA